MVPVTNHGSGDAVNKYTPRSGVTEQYFSRPLSLQNIITAKSNKLDDIMQDFHRNGADFPYNPDEGNILMRQADQLTGVSPSSAYLRQKSWPEPERTPVAPLPSWKPSVNAAEFIPSSQRSAVNTPVLELPRPILAANQAGAITAEQLRVLNALSDDDIRGLLRVLDIARRSNKRTECRFCKNNREAELYYRSHALKDEFGRLTCPVLRAFQCRRCGATGDNAHTAKYCPFSTTQERIFSTAVMRSIHMGSQHRRKRYQYNNLDNQVYTSYTQTAPLDPLWAALEQKLLP